MKYKIPRPSRRYSDELSIQTCLDVDNEWLEKIFSAISQGQNGESKANRIVDNVILSIEGSSYVVEYFNGNSPVNITGEYTLGNKQRVSKYVVDNLIHD